MKKLTDGLSYAGWVRNQILLNPEITLEELEALHTKENWTKPFHRNTIYLQKNILCKRWGVKKPSDITRNPITSGINVSALIRLYLAKYGDTTPEKAIIFFATDGVTLTKAAYYGIRHALSQESPDENKNNGPRAGKPDKKPRTNKLENYAALLLKTKEFIKEIGSIQEVRSLLNFIEELQS